MPGPKGFWNSEAMRRGNAEKTPSRYKFPLCSLPSFVLVQCIIHGPMRFLKCNFNSFVLAIRCYMCCHGNIVSLYDLFMLPFLLFSSRTFVFFLFSSFASFSLVCLTGRRNGSAEDVLENSAVYGAQTNTTFNRDQTENEIHEVLQSYGDHAIGKLFNILGI